MSPQEFIKKAIPLAIKSGHIWPDYAVCEAALESDWGNSLLAIKANNLFGSKQHSHPDHGTLSLPTREYIDVDHDGKREWVVTSADWEVFDSWQEAFAARMETLKRLAPKYAHYAAALVVTTGQDYVNEVSKSWATDPNRAKKVIQIHTDHVHTLANEIATFAVDVGGDVSAS